MDSKTPPCVHSKRPRVCRHHAHMCFNMFAWCWYTWRRFERTHGDVFESTHGEQGRGSGSSSVLLTKNCPRLVITSFRGSPKKLLDLSHFKFKDRSRTTRHRFLQSFALLDKAVQFQQSGGKLWRESAIRWFELSFQFSFPSLPSTTTTTTTTHDTQRQGDRDTKTERDRERRQ